MMSVPPPAKAPTAPAIIAATPTVTNSTPVIVRFSGLSDGQTLPKNVELMPQHQDLGLQLVPPEAVAQHADEQEADCNHAAIMF